MIKLKKIIASAMSLAIACTAVPMTASMTTSAAMITHLQGDVDGSGSISLADLTMFTRYLNGGLTITKEDLTRMDAIPNKVINMQDYNRIYNFYFGIETPRTITSEVLLNIRNEAREYKVYNCDTRTEVGSYTLQNSTSTANLNSRIFEDNNYDDYVDDQNINTVKVGNGSGFIVGDNLVATAAHCVYSPEGYAQNLKVKVYNQAGTESIKEFDAQFIHIPSLYKNSVDNNNNDLNYDYALIYVKNHEDGSNISQYGVWSLGFPSYEFDGTGAKVIASGFTGKDGTSKPHRRYYSCGPMATTNSVHKIHALSMVYGGKSGGPVYYEDTYYEPPVKSVIGINSYVITDENDIPIDNSVWAVRITPTISRFFLDNPNIEAYARNTAN